MKTFDILTYSPSVWCKAATSMPRGVATWWPGGATATIGQRMATLPAPPTSRHGKKIQNTKNPPEQKRYKAEINALVFFLSSRLILSFVTYATSPIFATCWATPPSTAQDTNQRACILTALQWRLAANHWIPL